MPAARLGPLPLHHEKRDRPKTGDAEKNDSFFPNHVLTNSLEPIKRRPRCRGQKRKNPRDLTLAVWLFAAVLAALLAAATLLTTLAGFLIRLLTLLVVLLAAALLLLTTLAALLVLLIGHQITPRVRCRRVTR